MKWLFICSILFAMVFTACAEDQGDQDAHRFKKAVFAGGCFWCMEPAFEEIDGVKEVVSGYTGGRIENPSYEDVSAGETGHIESVQVTYDPEQVTYDQLLTVFWRQIDPTDALGQFADRGQQYKTAVFYADDTEKTLAEQSREAIRNSGKYHGEIVTQIMPSTPFYPAEQYHQDYYKKNPQRYKMYRTHSGRTQYLKQIWGEEAH